MTVDPGSVVTWPGWVMVDAGMTLVIMDVTTMGGPRKVVTCPG